MLHSLTDTLIDFLNLHRTPKAVSINYYRVKIKVFFFLFFLCYLQELEVEVSRTRLCRTASLERDSRSPWESWNRQPIRNATHPIKENSIDVLYGGYTGDAMVPNSTVGESIASEKFSDIVKGRFRRYDFA